MPPTRNFGLDSNEFKKDLGFYTVIVRRNRANFGGFGIIHIRMKEKLET
jgi:hypothetical protein